VKGRPVGIFEVKVERFGRSLRILLPEEVIEQLKAREGDSIYL
jgi:antitoxin component of MazEF toxin-antitoxin module